MYPTTAKAVPPAAGGGAAAPTIATQPQPPAEAAQQRAHEPPRDASGDEGEPVAPTPAEQPGAERQLYDDAPPTSRKVEWDEAAVAKADEIVLDHSLYAHAEKGEEGDKARAKLAEAFAAAGAGPTIAAEIYADAARAARETYKPTSTEDAATELRELWGDQFQSKIDACRQLVQRAAAADPSIIGFLDKTGLGNDPRFIRKIAARIAARESARKRK
jgi:hypothetical protein